MTLDVAKFISNSIETQCKIQHCQVKVRTVKRKSVPHEISKKIAEQYGENYMLDADYVTFFWGMIDREVVKKLFNVVDRALGENANRLTETDFKKLELDIEQNEPDEDDSDDEDSDEEIEEVDVDIEDDDNVSNDTEDSSSNEKNLNEDDESKKKTSYFFLKITMK